MDTQANQSPNDRPLLRQWAMTVVVAGVVGLVLSWFALDWIEARFYDIDVLRECVNDELRSGRYDLDDPNMADVLTAVCAKASALGGGDVDLAGFRTAYKDMPTNVTFEFGGPDRWAASYLSAGWIVSALLGAVGVASALVLRHRAMPWAALLTAIGLAWHAALVFNVMAKDSGVLLAGPWVGLVAWALVAGGTLALSLSIQARVATASSGGSE